MTTMKVMKESLKISAGKAAVPVTLHKPDADARPGAIVVICNPLPLSGEASHHLIEAIIDALVENGAAVATYEPACEGLILEDFDKYSASDGVAEIDAVARHFAAANTQHSKKAAQVVVLGYGVGAILTAMVAADASVSSLCLLNPMLPGDVAAWRNRDGADDHDAKMMPAEFAATITSLDPTAALAKFAGRILILNGPADRFAKAESADHYVSAARDTDRIVMHLLLACGDHALSDPAARQAAIERIVQFSEPRG